MKQTVKVAIDGPSGAGKSTIARAAAEQLEFVYVDTGAMYRTVALNALRKGIDLSDKEQITDSLNGLEVSLGFVNGAQRGYLNSEDVSEQIRTPEVSMAASKVSAVQSVRDFLFQLQRDIADKNNCLMDGRDIGTVVLPDAQVKIFLTASAEKRAERRFAELKEKGMDVNFEDVLKDIIQRDYNDSHRDIAPLKPTEQSIVIDTTSLDLEQSIDAVLNTVKENI